MSYTEELNKLIYIIRGYIKEKSIISIEGSDKLAEQPIISCIYSSHRGRYEFYKDPYYFRNTVSKLLFDWKRIKENGYDFDTEIAISLDEEETKEPVPIQILRYYDPLDIQYCYTGKELRIFLPKENFCLIGVSLKKRLKSLEPDGGQLEIRFGYGFNVKDYNNDTILISKPKDRIKDDDLFVSFNNNVNKNYEEIDKLTLHLQGCYPNGNRNKYNNIIAESTLKDWIVDIVRNKNYYFTRFTGLEEDILEINKYEN